MNFNKDKGGKSQRRLLPPFILCALSILLFLSSSYLSFVGVVIALVAPAPIAIIGLRHGLRNMLIGLVFSSLILYVSFGELVTASFLLGTGFLGAALAFIATRVKTAGEAMLLFVVSSVAGKLIFMSAILSLTGHNPFMFDEEALRAMFSSFTAGGVSEEMMSGLIQQIPLLLPSFLTLAAGLDCFVNYLFVSKWDERLGSETKIPRLPPFEDWDFPRSLLLALLVSLILPMFELDGEASRVALSAELNLKIIVNLLFFVQGMSFVWWWTLHKKFSRPIRVLIVVIFLIPIFSMGLIAVGIGDIWLRLREKVKGAKKK